MSVDRESKIPSHVLDIPQTLRDIKKDMEEAEPVLGSDASALDYVRKGKTVPMMVHKETLTRGKPIHS